MKIATVSLACVLSAISAQAANIAWVTFHANGTGGPAIGSDAANNTTLTGAPYSFTSAPDIGYTDLLTGAGHTVTRIATTDNLTTASPLISQLNGFDLVIVGRSVNSAHYQTDTESAAWNSITAPMILASGFVTRGGDPAGSIRLGFTQGETTVDTPGNVSITVLDPNHPIFQGMTLGAGNTLSYALGPQSTPGGSVQRGISLNNHPLVAGGVQLANIPSIGANATVIAEFQAGISLDTDGPAATPTGPRDILGGHRMVILTGSRENATANNTQSAGIYDLTPEGGQLLLNAVDYMAVPEPSTYALIGLGGMALFFRRRKA